MATVYIEFDDGSAITYYDVSAYAVNTICDDYLNEFEWSHKV